jgi:hypothetical protein
MADEIRFQRGPESRLPLLDNGEPAITMDTGKLFIGTPSGNVEFAQQSTVDGLSSSVAQIEALKAKNLYNLKGDGITDDTAGLQQYFNDGVQLGIVYLPYGTYRFTSKLIIPDGIRIVGEKGKTNQQCTRLLYDGALNSIAVEAVKLDGSSNPTSFWGLALEYISIVNKRWDDTTQDFGTDSTGIKLNMVSEGYFNNFQVTGFKVGILSAQANICDFHKCYVTSNQYGIWLGYNDIDGNSIGASEMNNFYGLNFWNNETHVVLGGESNFFIGTHMEQAKNVFLLNSKYAASANNFEFKNGNIRNGNYGFTDHTNSRLLKIVQEASFPTAIYTKLKFTNSNVRLYGSDSALEVEFTDATGSKAIEIAVEDMDIYGINSLISTPNFPYTTLSLRGKNKFNKNFLGDGGTSSTSSHSLKVVGENDVAVSVKVFGATGDGVTDDTQAIQSALNNARNVEFPDGTYSISTTSTVVFTVLSNTKITFSKNAKIVLKANDKDVCFIFHLSQVDNVTMINPYIIGDKDTHLGTTGEWGHGINIEHSSNIKIINPRIENCWGDGIYIGVAFGNVVSRQTENILIEKPYISGVRRNGISVSSGKNINIVAPIIKNLINGIAPMAGIDIEPEGTGTTNPVLENISIENPYTESCQYGILFAPELLKDTGKKVDVKILNHVDYQSDYGFKAWTLTGALNGLIEIISPIWKSNWNNGANIQDYSVNGAMIQIKNPTIIDCNRGNTTDLYATDSAIAVHRTVGDAGTQAIGNVHVFEETVIDTRSPVTISAGIYFLDDKGIGVQKCSFVDPMLLQTRNSGRNVLNGEVTVKDRLGIMVGDNSYFEQEVAGYSLRSLYHNGLATGIITYTLNDSLQMKGEITFEVRAGYQLRIAPSVTSRIAPLSATNGKYVESSTVGASITIKKMSNNVWMITKMIGTWTVQA